MLSIITLFVSVLCLIADLGRPDHALMVLLSPTFSFMTLGAYSLTISALLACLVVLAWLKVVRLSDKVFRLISVFLLAASFVVVVYTALLLGSLVERGYP